jgi:hypothetical protein
MPVVSDKKYDAAHKRLVKLIVAVNRQMPHVRIESGRRDTVAQFSHLSFESVNVQARASGGFAAHSYYEQRSFKTVDEVVKYLVQHFRGGGLYGCTPC